MIATIVCCAGFIKKEASRGFLWEKLEGQWDLGGRWGLGSWVPEPESGWVQGVLTAWVSWGPGGAWRPGGLGARVSLELVVLGAWGMCGPGGRGGLTAWGA